MYYLGPQLYGMCQVMIFQRNIAAEAPERPLENPLARRKESACWYCLWYWKSSPCQERWKTPRKSTTKIVRRNRPDSRQTHWGLWANDKWRGIDDRAAHKWRGIEVRFADKWRGIFYCGDSFENLRNARGVETHELWVFWKLDAADTKLNVWVPLMILEKTKRE